MKWKKHHTNKSPWTGYWHHHPRLHGWPQVRQDKRRFLFVRFARGLAFFALLVAGGMALLSWILTRIVGGSGQTTAVLWVVGIVLVLGFPLLAAGLALRAFRGFATPLADVMAAADAVAEGDLSVRVPVRGTGEFARLAESFNRMAEELARADQQRRNLTADVAHELRTPLQIIQGNLEGILDGVYEPTAEHLEVTLEETRLLTRLVEDLRTLSLAEAGQLPLVWEAVDVAELLADVGTSFSGQAEAAGIDLQVETEEAPNAGAITGDVGRLTQVLGNLLANALRYTPAGGAIVMRATARPDGVRIVVQDSGQGIPAEDLPYVFDRFWRGDRARSHKGGVGSGLGLAIARQLVQAHGGRIAIASEEGQGTTFTIDLPAAFGKAEESLP